MATHDYNIANASGSAVRQDLNNVLQAIVTNNSSDTEPGTTFSHQIWVDTTANIIKIRNEANDAWIDWIKITGEPLIPDGTVALPAISFASETDSGIYRIGANEIGIATSATERVSISDTETVFNEDGEDTNFRVEGDNEANLLFVDAGTDRIGIGDGAPGTAVEIHNTAPDITIRNTTEEDVDGGRESRVIFEGEQSGGEISTLARIEASHDGTADDEAGQLIFSTNDGSDGVTPTAALTIDSNQNATFAGDVTAESLNGGQLAGTRNFVMNGSFQIDQRNNGAAVTPAVVSSYTVDRFRVLQSVVSTLTVERQAAVVPAGFTHAVEITLAANHTPTAAEQFFFGTTFEANNLGRLGFGAAGAVATILSFWVRASVTGTYSVSWTNDANDRSYIGTYTINTADTWEHKTVTFTGDTTGTWVNSGTGRHSFLSWDLGAGSDFDGTADTWQAGNLRKTAASVDFVDGTNGDTFYLAGVQLEVGTVATPFEHRNYQSELVSCQRYYNQITLVRGGSQEIVSAGYGGANGRSWNYCFPEMRGSPNVTYLNNTTGNIQYFHYTGGYWQNSNAIAWVNQNQYHAFYVPVNTSGRPFLIRKTGTTDLIVQLSAEL